MYLVILAVVLFVLGVALVLATLFIDDSEFAGAVRFLGVVALIVAVGCAIAIPLRCDQLRTAPARLAESRAVIAACNQRIEEQLAATKWSVIRDWKHIDGLYAQRLEAQTELYRRQAHYGALQRSRWVPTGKDITFHVDR